MKLKIFVIFILGFTSGFSQNDSLIPKKHILQLHNYYRKIYRERPLIWSDTLQVSAQRWADHLAKTGHIHKSNTDYGENIFWSDSLVDWAKAIDFWIKEQKYYHGEPVSKQGLFKYQHYTQIIWNSTRYVGCGIAKTKGGLYIYVCHYYPKGNKTGEKPYE